MTNIYKDYSELNLRNLLQRFVTKGPLNADQERWFEEYESGERITHVSGDRASGRTTFGLGIIACESVLKPNNFSMVMTQRLAIAENFRDMIVSIIEDIFGYFGFYEAFDGKNRKQLRLTNGSRINFAPAGPNYFRGLTLNHVFLDFSCGTMESIDDEIYACLLPGLASSNGRLLVSL
jgi:hypothetical protein